MYVHKIISLQNNFQVRDGADVKSNMIGKYCGYSTPSPIFSTGQNLWLHFYTRLSSHGVDYQNVDITYTTTDKGNFYFELWKETKKADGD